MNKSEEKKAEEFNKENDLKDFQNSKLYKFLIDLFDEYLLTELQRLAAFKFIKEKFTDTEGKDAVNLKKWLLLKVNGKIYPENAPKLQLGCSDLVPGLTIQPWWEPSQFKWIDSLLENFKVLQEELVALRENKGFQPYKCPKYVSNITVIY